MVLLVTLMGLSCVSNPSVRTGDDNVRATPSRSPEVTAESGCDVKAPRRVMRSRFNLPIQDDGEGVRLPLTFPDGTRATLTYPADLGVLEDSVSLYTTGGAPHKRVRPQVSYRGVHFRIRGAPIDCPVGRDGSRAGVWQHPDGRVLVMRFGNWYVSIFDDHTNLGLWARHLRGRVTGDGWLILKGSGRLRIGPEAKYGEAEIMLGGLDPGLLIWPAKCERSEDTAADALSGEAIDGPGSRQAFASWCDREATMRVHVYAGVDFIKAVAAGLQIDDVRLAHPLARYRAFR